MANLNDILKLAKTTTDWTKKNAKKTASEKVGSSVKSFNQNGGGQAVAAGIGAASPLISQGNHNVVGDLGVGIGGAVASFNPLLGGAIMLGGTLINAATGSNIKEDVVKGYQDAIVDYSRPEITAQDNTQLMNQLMTMKPLKIRRGDLGTQGWFSHKLDDQYGSLLTDLRTAETSRANLIDSAVSNVDKMNDARVAMNYMAFGGPMYGYMSDGAIAYDMARDNLMVKMMNAQGKNGSQPANTFAVGGLLSDNFTNGVTEIGAGGTHEKNPYAGVPMGLAEDGQPNLVEEGEAIYNDYVFSNRLKVPEAIRSKYRLRGPKDMTYAEAFLNAQKESEERENDPISKNGLDNIAMILAQSQEEVKAKKESRKKAHGGHLFAIGSSLDNPPFDAGSMTPEEFYRINNYWPDGYDPSTGQWMTIGEPSNWTPEKLTSINGTPAPARTASAPVIPEAEPKKVAPAKTATSGTDSYLSDGVNPLRLAPLVGNIGAVLMDTFGVTNTPRTFNFVPNFTPIGFSPLGDYVPEFHVDTRYAANQAAQQAAATRGAIMNTTAPNRFAGLLAADYNAQIANGQLLRDAQIADYDNLIKARTFNRATNQNNSEMGLRAAANDSRDRLAYAQAKLAEAKANVDETNASWGARGQNVRALTTSFGNLGKELDARDMVKWLTVKGVLGNYSEADLRGMGIDEDTIKEVKGDRYVGTKSHGGKLKKKRGGFTY